MAESIDAQGPNFGEPLMHADDRVAAATDEYKAAHSRLSEAKFAAEQNKTPATQAAVELAREEVAHKERELLTTLRIELADKRIVFFGPAEQALVINAAGDGFEWSDDLDDTAESHSPLTGVISSPGLKMRSSKQADPDAIGDVRFVISLDGRPGRSLKAMYTGPEILGVWEILPENK